MDVLYFRLYNTSLVEDMVYMFYGCTSLKYLIIFNFNFDKINTDGVKDIFGELQNLEYLDIYNITDSNNLLYQNELNGLNNKTNLIVCQNKTVVITNPNATYDCCNIIEVF